MPRKLHAHYWILIVLGSIFLSLLGFVWWKNSQYQPFSLDEGSFLFDQNSQELQEERSGDYETLSEFVLVAAENLEVPWEIVFLPGGDMLVSQRPGSLVRINSAERKEIDVSGVYHFGEGGLLGIAFHPDFEENNFLYAYFTTQTSQGPRNKVERYVLDLEENQLSEPFEIIGNIPAASIHNGGRIAFGPDRLLYVTTGDAGSPQDAQNRNSLAGKILRVGDDGETPPGNPFGNQIFSYGHRNPQGIAWDEEGRLWSTEHGPSGPGSGFDEINLIEKGGNYGWPEIQGSETMQGMESPILESGSRETWAPGGIEIIGNKIFFAGLRGQATYSAEISNGGIENFQRHLRSQFGRLRVAKLGPDGFVYIATSNRDGRGNPSDFDDRILKIDPGHFE